MNQGRDVAAIILAAGESSRLGQPKQLLMFRGKTLVRNVVDAATGAGCAPVIVVVGSEVERIENELSNATATVIDNATWKHGIGSSISCGVRWLAENRPATTAAVLLVSDQPLVDQNVISRLISVYDTGQKPIVASSYNGTLGVPALFEQALFPELIKLSADEGAKKIILANGERVAKFHFPRGAIDIDNLDDLANLNASGFD